MNIQYEATQVIDIIFYYKKLTKYYVDLNFLFKNTYSYFVEVTQDPYKVIENNFEESVMSDQNKGNTCYSPINKKVTEKFKD